MKALTILLAATVVLLAAGCADLTQNGPPATPFLVGEALSAFPELPSLDERIYDNIKRTCSERWQLERMHLDTFEVIPDGDECLVRCDGVEHGTRYHYAIRVDSAGNWINDGRTRDTS